MLEVRVAVRPDHSLLAALPRFFLPSVGVGSGVLSALRRGRVTLACNLGADPVAVPFTGELVLCSEPISVGEQGAELPSHSFAILRAVDN